jgi:hypothetical protein
VLSNREVVPGKRVLKHQAAGQHARGRGARRRHRAGHAAALMRYEEAEIERRKQAR